MQETLIAIHARRATYDPALPFTAWVYGIARYKLIDEYRREKRRATVPLDEAGDLFAHDEAEAALPGAMSKSCWPNCRRQAPAGAGHQAGRRLDRRSRGKPGPVGIRGEGDGASRAEIAGRRMWEGD